MYLINYVFPYLIIRADKYVFNCHFRGFIGSSSGLLLVSKRASRPRFAPSAPPRFPNPAHKRADGENPDFPPLARTSINSPFEGLFVARERTAPMQDTCGVGCLYISPQFTQTRCERTPSLFLDTVSIVQNRLVPNSYDTVLKNRL